MEFASLFEVLLHGEFVLGSRNFVKIHTDESSRVHTWALIRLGTTSTGGELAVSKGSHAEHVPIFDVTATGSTYWQAGALVGMAASCLPRSDYYAPMKYSRRTTLPRLIAMSDFIGFVRGYTGAVLDSACLTSFESHRCICLRVDEITCMLIVHSDVATGIVVSANNTRCTVSVPSGVTYLQGEGGTYMWQAEHTGSIDRLLGNVARTVSDVCAGQRTPSVMPQ